MTLHVYVEGCDDDFECMYSGFGKFRGEILRGWNQELAKLYLILIGLMHFSITMDMKDLRELNLSVDEMMDAFKNSKNIENKIDNILNEYDKPYNEGMKLFYNHSDCDGEFTPAECELILKAFERVDPEKFDKSDKDNNDWYRESYVTWKKMLKYAIENKKSIFFG